MVALTLGKSGLGALVVAAVAPDGSLDPAASLSGFARVWRFSMKRVQGLFAIALCVSAPALAQTANATVGELLASLNSPPANKHNWIVVPIAGSGPGQAGTFHTDLAVTGSHGFYNDARLAIAWLPLDRDASADPVQFIVHGSEFDYGFIMYANGLGNAGFGALVIAAVDSGGALDAEGDVRANVRIWSSSSCAGKTSLGYESSVGWARTGARRSG